MWTLTDQFANSVLRILGHTRWLSEDLPYLAARKRHPREDIRMPRYSSLCSPSSLAWWHRFPQWRDDASPTVL
jgi:hypothetical protein